MTTLAAGAVKRIIYIAATVRTHVVELDTHERLLLFARTFACQSGIGGAN